MAGGARARSDLRAGRDGCTQLLRSEWIKFRTVRGWMIGIIIVPLVTVGIALLNLIPIIAAVVTGPDWLPGYQQIVPGPGEPHLVRLDIGGLANPGRFGRRRPLMAFSQFSDIHMLDAESPARVEFLDRYGDPGQPEAAEVSNLDGSYRPQEMLTVQVADAMVRAVNRVGRGPATGAPLAFTICTGDNVDNTQYNEVR